MKKYIYIAETTKERNNKIKYSTNKIYEVTTNIVSSIPESRQLFQLLFQRRFSFHRATHRRTSVAKKRLQSKRRDARLRPTKWRCERLSRGCNSRSVRRDSAEPKTRKKKKHDWKIGHCFCTNKIHHTGIIHYFLPSKQK